MRVLVVEDERRLAANVARALREGAGYAVDVATMARRRFNLATLGGDHLLVLDHAAEIGRANPEYPCTVVHVIKRPY